MPDPKHNTDLDLVSLALYLARQRSDDSLPDSAVPVCYGSGGQSATVPALQAAMLALLVAQIQDAVAAGQTWVCHGPSLQTLAGQLADRGVNSIWVDPLGRDSQSAPTTDGDHGRLHPGQSFLEVALPENCAGIILEGTINYLDQLHVLQRARTCLMEGGRLLLLGEFLDDDSNIAYSPLPNLASCRDLSARLGLVLQDEHDLSNGAINTLSALAASLQADADSHPQLVARLLPAVQAISDEFDSGRRCLRLFDWRWQPNDNDEYAAAEYDDIHSFAPAEIGELFQRSFNVDFNPALWHWKYQLGDGKCVVARARPGAPIVAHYGGAPRRIQYFGQPATAIQVCDVMVLPETRRQYGRSSLFFRTAATFLEREIGNSVRHLLGFGFPNQKAMNIAKRLQLYEKTDEFVELLLPAAASPWPVTELNVDAASDTIDRLWRLMAADFSAGIIGARDSSYFQYRYGEHPYGRAGLYRSVRIGGDEPKAVAVLKQQAGHWLVMDVIAARADIVSALRSLVTWAQSALGEDGLRFWVTRAYVEELHSPGAIVNELGIEIPCNSWNRGPSAELLAGKWWLTAGDMDFV